MRVDEVRFDVGRVANQSYVSDRNHFVPSRNLETTNAWFGLGGGGGGAIAYRGSAGVGTARCHTTGTVTLEPLYELTR